MPALTPMLQQYHRIKKKHEDCIVLFRLGDFYEMFYDDAKQASAILDLVLTSRGTGPSGKIPMCGVPYHAAANYIARLIKAKCKVAICEQTEDPATAKGIVKREVIRVITSGTFIDEESIDSRYILSLNPNKETVGVAFTDTTSGTIQTNQYQQKQKVIDLIAKLPFCECIFPLNEEEKAKEIFAHPLLRGKTIALTPYQDWSFNLDIAQQSLREHFGTHSLGGFGIDNMDLSITSSGALLEYLKEMNKQPLRHIDKISIYTDDDYVYISSAALLGLEMEELVKTIDITNTPMGKRQFKFWFYHPLKNRGEILKRQGAISLLKENDQIREKLKDILRNIPDIEKSLSRLSCGYTYVKDYLTLRNTLLLLPQLQEAADCLSKKNTLFSIRDIPQIRDLLEKAINPQIPLSHWEGKVIRRGYNQKLDDLRDIQEKGNEWLKNLQSDEIKRTKINSLKIGFNNVFGYYIEVTKTNMALVPPEYIRKQTLANAERFITPELKQFEEKMLAAQDNILEIERKLLQDIQKEILNHSRALHAYSFSIATIDALLSLSLLALRDKYCLPQINDGYEITIKNGRHIVVENTLSDSFVPNDTELDDNDNRLLIITGPNMAGKSTYIRQVAILVILAQTGSFIPADSASIGLVDKIFTRIGAHDAINKGQSTFMVEMNETAEILNNLSSRSLIILDEIGRGTSTFDGLSLAWAVAEYLQKHKSRTLFATHFHELTALAEEYSGVKNYNIAVKEWRDEIVFLHKIIPGGTDDSYGIYVAKLAGIPKEVV
ncbi:MAG: DNA mismatch repair protein MutS, partial [Candidatus Omnitrophota bacterium]